MSNEPPHHPDRVVVPFPEDVPRSTPIGSFMTKYINVFSKLLLF